MASSSQLLESIVRSIEETSLPLARSLDWERSGHPESPGFLGRSHFLASAHNGSAFVAVSGKTLCACGTVPPLWRGLLPPLWVFILLFFLMPRHRLRRCFDNAQVGRAFCFVPCVRHKGRLGHGMRMAPDRQTWATWGSVLRSMCPRKKTVTEDVMTLEGCFQNFYECLLGILVIFGQSQ